MVPRSMSEAFRNCLNEFKTLTDYGCKHRYIWSRLVLAQTALTNFCRLGYLRDIFTVLKGRGSNQGASWLGSDESPLSVLWKAVFLQCPLVWKEEGLWPLPLLAGTLIPSWYSPSGLHLNLITSQRPLLQIQSHWRVGLQRVNLEGTQMFSL